MPQRHRDTERNAWGAVAVVFLMVLGLYSGEARAQETDAKWKYRHVVVFLHHSGAHRANAGVLVEFVNRLAAMKPADVSFEVIGFAREFESLGDAKFRRKPIRLRTATTDLGVLQEALSDVVFHGPSPVFDALNDAIDAAAAREPAAVLAISNGVDNASDSRFEDIAARAEKARVPILAFYIPTNPPQNGDDRMKRLAKASGGKFIDVRLKDSWDQLVSALK